MIIVAVVVVTSVSCFRLADLLSLNLHNFEDEVHNIVDKTIKEMAMERMLKELEITWSAMEFQHELHQRTGYTLLR